MGFCYICNEMYQRKMGWQELFSVKETYLCEVCATSLKKIEGQTCPMCSRQQHKETPCFDCLRWEKQQLPLQNKSVFMYNDFLKEVIARFKYRGDYEVIKIFQEDWNKLVEKNKSNTLYVPIPLSGSRLYERGFNQSEALGAIADIPMVKALTRTNSEKQSKKTRNTRISTANPFQLIVDPSNIKDQKVILLDDLYTTGTTLRHAAQLLREAGATEVNAFTLARS